MKYNEKSFSVTLGGRRFSDGWEVAFAGACDGKEHPDVLNTPVRTDGRLPSPRFPLCCFSCDNCGMRVRFTAKAQHERICNGSQGE